MIELVKVTDGVALAYSHEQFRGDFNTTGTADRHLNPHGVYRVDNLPKPETDFGFKAVAWGFPRLVNGFWTAGWDVIEMSEAEARATIAPISPLQGILTLGETEWGKVLAYRETATWSEKVVIDNAADWVRTSQNIAFFGHLLDYTEEQMDTLFLQAAQVDA
jgi:hypothetical protein